MNPVGSTCNSASAQYKLKITPIPVVNAGVDNSLCQTATSVDLSDATVSNASSIKWSTSGGGVFGITNSTVGAGSVYYPTYLLPAGTNDVDKPSITLTLTAVGCATVTDTRVITFTPKPTANAGVDQPVCNETSSVSVTGTSTNSSSVIWSVQGAATSFATTSNATYNITGADRAAGFINLVFTAKGNGSCAPATDTMKVIIRPQPTINIGPNASFCSKNTSDNLAYNFPTITLTNGITPTWITTGTAFNLDYISNPLRPNYTISSTDITNGSVSITATTRSFKGCQTVSSAMTINITQAPTINIGPDINVCASTGNSIQLNSTSTNSLGSPSWSSNSSGSFNNPNSVTPIYSPTPTEEIAGKTTTVYAIISGNGSCPSATDSLKINFTAAPALAPLKDTVICYTTLPIVYSVSSGIVGDWSSNDPTGTYSPGPSGVQSIAYTTSTTASFTITFTTPIASCYLGASVTANITIVKSPSITVTSPIDVCDNNFAGGVSLASNPNLLNTSGVVWSILQGFGTIAAPTSANTTYTVKPDSSDFGLSDILVKVTAKGTNPSCAPAVDTVVIRTHKAPVVSSSNQVICSDQQNVAGAVTLNGSISSGFTNILWTPDPNISVATPTSMNSAATVTAFPATVTLKATGLHGSCLTPTATITINSQTAPTFISPANNIAGCSNGNLINLNNANMSPSTPAGVWSKKQALAGGTFNPNNIGATNITYNPSAADIAAGSINLIYTINNTGVCTKGYADTIKVVFNNPITIKTVNPVTTFCAQDNNLIVSAKTLPAVYAAGPIITWSVPNGVGILTQTGSPGALSAIYDPNPLKVPNGGDVANGGAVLMVKLTNVSGCPNDSSYLSLILVPEPAAIVNAGASQKVCVDRDFVNLQGLIINADGGYWSVKNGGILPAGVNATAGNFVDSTNLETKYKVSAADRAKAKIRLYLFSVGGNSKCHQVVDSVDVSFTPRPVPSVVASAPKVCADVDSINVKGSFSASGINGIWSSSGDGVYTNLGIYAPSPTYIPGPADISAGKVIFTYSSDNYQDCKAYSATDTTIITPKIVANAGPNLVVCGNDSTGIILNASSPPNNTGKWKPLGIKGTDWAGKFTTALNSHQASYIPADSIDPTIAAISFRYTTTGSAPCKADSAQMVLKIAPAPTVTIAANQQTVCNDATSLNLSVTSMTVATGGYWNTSGTGSFTSPSALTTKYNFSKSDLDSTNIKLFFITTGNTSNGSSCNPAGDAVIVTLKQKPVVSASAANSCVTSSGIILDNSFVTQAGNLGVSGVWSASTVPAAGAGQFSLDQFISNGANATRYYPSAKDVSNGTVTLTLTSAAAGTCLPVSRSVILNVSTTPIADAGKDLFVCTDSIITLKANPKVNLVNYAWQDITTPGAVKTGLEVKDGPILATKTYVLTVTDNKGCSNTDTVAVNTVTNPNLTQLAQQCYDFYGFVHVAIGGTTSPLGGFQWYYNNGLMSSETRDSVRVTQPGLYQVRYTLGGCTDASNKATDILDIPRIRTVNYIACKNTTVTAKVSEIPNAQLTALGLKPYTYNWAPASASITNTAVLPTSTANLTVADTLYYDVSSSFTTAFVTCSYKDSVRIISIPVPQPFVADTSQACAGTAINFDATIAPSNIPSLAAFNPVFKWYVESDPIATSIGNSKLFSTSTTNNYVVKTTIDQCSGYDTAVVYMKPYPPKVLVSEITQCFEQVPSLTLDAGPGSVGALGLTGVTYQWTSGSGDPALGTSTSQTTVITYPMIKDLVDEEIVAYAYITNHFGTLTCVNIDTATVKDICVPRIFPPTAFHPIGSGTASAGGGTGNIEDEFFTIKGKYFTNFKITVYSRWGEVIFYSEDPNTYWDGTYRGELMPVGVYAYIITYEGKDIQTKGPFKKEGRVVLIR